jgi:hypothetical protein
VFSCLFTESLCDFYRKLEDNGFSNINEILSVHIKYFEQSRSLAVEHRYVHEHGTAGPPRPPAVPKPVTSLSSVQPSPSQATGNGVDSRQSTVDARSKFEQALMGAVGKNDVGKSDTGTKTQQSLSMPSEVNSEKLFTSSALSATDKSVASDAARKSTTSEVQKSTMKNLNKFVKVIKLCISLLVSRHSSVSEFRHCMLLRTLC